MRLYHFTAATESHLGSVFRDGQIRTTESNLSRDIENYGPPVVWLTKQPRRPKRRQGWARISDIDKTEARLTVEVPGGEAFSWEPWARRKGCPPEWIRGLADTGGGARDWYVTERPIVVSEIVEVTLFRDGSETVWRVDAFVAAFPKPPNGSSPWEPWPPDVPLDEL